MALAAQRSHRILREQSRERRSNPWMKGQDSARPAAPARCREAGSRTHNRV